MEMSSFYCHPHRTICFLNSKNIRFYWVAQFFAPGTADLSAVLGECVTLGYPAGGLQGQRLPS